MAILFASSRSSPLAFARTHEDRTLPVDAAASGGRDSAISRAVPANRYGGMAAAAIWNTA
jgi:hypothetical protein